jgi:6-phosphofructokinase 1
LHEEKRFTLHSIQNSLYIVYDHDTIQSLVDMQLVLPLAVAQRHGIGWHRSLPRKRCNRKGRIYSSSGQSNPWKFSVDISDVEEVDPYDVLTIPNLRDKLQARPSPFITNNHFGGGFVSDDDRVALSALRYASAESIGADCMSDEEECMLLPGYAIRAGARETIFMNPGVTKIAIVTCGGLCPGLNDVVQGLVNKCEDYGVPEGNILGIQYGFRGFYDKEKPPVTLTKRNVEGIHLEGGTILGTSRGGANLAKIVRQIDIMGIDVVFVVGGNGGNAGAAAIQQACEENNVLCSVIGVPKSIDNDILLIDKCFGFDTAVEEAQRAIICAKVEASSAYNGVGIVKVMGRQSGFIALDASMSSGVVDICLIPEVPFKFQGPRGLISYIEKVIARKGHCVICVAEGAGQDILAAGAQDTDASGNPILKDAGKWLRNEIKKNLKDVDMKYIDPSTLCLTLYLYICMCFLMLDTCMQVILFDPFPQLRWTEYIARFWHIMPFMLLLPGILEWLLGW